MDFSGFNFSGMADPKPGSPSKIQGSDGVAAPGGILLQSERNRRLQGDQKWITFANTIRSTLIVASAFRAWDALARSAQWTAEPNPLGGRKAQKMADIARDGLLEAPMPKPWNAVVGKTLTGAAFLGFAMHAWQGQRREVAGRPWVFTNIEHRPQHSISQWVKPSETEPWTGVIQRTRLGGVYPIARSRLFYVGDDTITDSPDGAGFLQHLVEHADHLRSFEKQEGIGFQTNLAGVPIGRAPLARLRQQALQALNLSEGSLDQEGENKIQAFIAAQVKFLVDFLEGHIKTPELSILLDSAPYLATGDGKTTPTAMLQWALETVRVTGLSLSEVAAAINRVGREMARLMGVEHMMMGDSEGARSVHGDKTGMLLLYVNSRLSSVGFHATSQLAWPMTELNGYDAETCAPRLRPQPIPLETIESVCSALQSLALARGPLPPQWEGVNVLLQRANLPPIPDDALILDSMRKPAPEPKKPTPDNTGEDPNADNPGTGATA